MLHYIIFFLFTEITAAS